MALSKQQLFDRKEWLRKLKAQASISKVVRVTLTARGATLGEIKAYLGNGFEIKEDNGTVIIAVKQKMPT